MERHSVAGDDPERVDALYREVEEYRATLVRAEGSTAAPGAEGAEAERLRELGYGD